MAVDRPWVTPEEVIAYSEIEDVQNRTSERLLVDIGRAEQYVIAYTHNNFSDYDTIPGAVKTAIILLAEVYASYATWIKKTGGGTLQSESFDDYSYSGSGATLDELIEGLNLAALLDDYVLSVASGNVTMRLRRL